MFKNTLNIENKTRDTLKQSFKKESLEAIHWPYKVKDWYKQFFFLKGTKRDDHCGEIDKKLKRTFLFEIN